MVRVAVVGVAAAPRTPRSSRRRCSGRSRGAAPAGRPSTSRPVARSQSKLPISAASIGQLEPQPVRLELPGRARTAPARWPRRRRAGAAGRRRSSAQARGSRRVDGERTDGRAVEDHERDADVAADEAVTTGGNARPARSRAVSGTTSGCVPGREGRPRRATRPAAPGGPGSPAGSPSPLTTVSTSPSSETAAASAPSRRTARPVSRCSAREPSAVDSSRRTAASRSPGEPVAGSGAVTAGFLPPGRAGTRAAQHSGPGGRSAPGVTGPTSREETRRRWPGRALPGGFRESARRPAGVADEELRPPARRSTSGQATSSSIARRPRAAGPRPGRRERRAPRAIVGAAGQVASGQRPGDGGRPLPGTGRTCCSPATDPVGRPAAPHASAPPWRVRALHGGRVGGGSRREPSCVEVGRRPEVHRRRRARWRPRSACGRGRARGPSRRSRSPGEGGDRSRRARGGAEDGVQRLAAVVARTAFGQARACAHLGGGAGPGNELRGSRGPDRRAGRGTAADRHGSPRARTSPVATPDAGTCGGQPVARERSGVHAVLRRGRPLLHGGPAASTAVRSTPDRGEAAPQRGKTPRARSWGGRDRGGAGHLAQHHGAVGRGLAGPGGRGPPQARYSPSGPAPQSAIRRAGARRPGRARAAAARRGATGRGRPGRGRQARYSPCGPAPQSAARRTRRQRPGRGRRHAGTAAGGAGRRRDRAGHGRRLHRAQRNGADAAARGRRRGGRRPGARRGGAGGSGPPSARSSTSKRAATLRPASRATGSAGTRAAVARSLLLMSPPGSRVRDRGRCRGQGER